jgi:hypothetical protein
VTVVVVDGGVEDDAVELAEGLDVEVDDVEVDDVRATLNPTIAMAPMVDEAVIVVVIVLQSVVAVAAVDA